MRRPIDNPTPTAPPEEAVPGPTGREAHTSQRQVVGVAGAGTLAAVLAACGPQSKTGPPQQQPAPTTEVRFGQGDLGLLNYFYVLESIEFEFFDRAQKSRELRGQAADLVNDIRQADREHQENHRSLVNLLGGDAVEVPKIRYPVKSQAEILDFAVFLKDLVADAYLGQVGHVTDDDIVKTVLRIQGVEARQSAALNDLTGRPLIPDGAFADAKTMEQTLGALRPHQVR